MYVAHKPGSQAESEGETRCWVLSILTAKYTLCLWVSLCLLIWVSS